MEEEFKILEKSVADIRRVLNDVHHAIVGNPLSKDGGMAKRLSMAEDDLEKLHIRLSAAEKKQIRYNLYVIIMWASLGGVGSLIIAYIIQTVFKR